MSRGGGNIFEENWGEMEDEDLKDPMLVIKNF